MVRSVWVAAFVCVVMGSGSLVAQMVDPSLDKKGEPFSYFSQPTDVIGVMDGREGTLVTPEGYLYTGNAEMMFFTGNPPVSVKQRVKTLHGGFYPIIKYQFEKQDIRYSFTMFAATLDGKPESPLMNFVRVEVRNIGKSQRTAFLSTAIRYQNDVSTDYGWGDNRFNRPVVPSMPGELEQAGEQFNPDWEYGFENDMALRSGKAVYLFPVDVPHEMTMTLKTGYNEQQEMGIYKLPVLPTSPIDVVTYTIPLKPGEEKRLDFKMPYEPIAKDSTVVGELRSASFDAYFRSTVNFWDELFSQGIDISVPEKKITNTFKASLVYSLIARDKIGNDYIQKVNEFQYDNFWLRDASYFTRMYDISGYHDIARQVLDFFPRWQREDGNFVSQGGQYDGWGQTLWAYGQHFRMICDTSFARSVFPSIKRAFSWLKDARAKDPLHVIPETTPGDNELISGHVTGHNFAALGGLQNAIHIADALGEKENAAMFRQEYQNYFETLEKLLRKIGSKTGGYMPPGLDTLGGEDWGNMESIYPEIVLNPFDSMVTNTLRATRAKYQEGIMTYGQGRYLHHYLTMSNTETQVIRGEQRQVVEEFYAILTHTSSTHAGFEFSVRPWGDRDFGMNMSPHGWFAAKYRTLLRNMLVREQENDLHLFSVVSPEWVKEGKSILVRRAPTYFGNVDLTMNFRKGRASLSISHRFGREPGRIILHLPWFMKVQSVTADGSSLSIQNRSVNIPLSASTVEIEWTKRNVPPMSYESTVQDFLMEYRRRYDEFLRTGKSH